MPVSFEQLKGHLDCVTCLLGHPKGLVSGSEDRSVRIWDTRMNRAVKCIWGPFDDEIGCLSLYPRDENLLCVGCDNKISIFDLRNTSAIIREASMRIEENKDCVNRICPATVGETDMLLACDDKGYTLLKRLSL